MYEVFQAWRVSMPKVKGPTTVNSIACLDQPDVSIDKYVLGNVDTRILTLPKVMLRLSDTQPLTKYSVELEMTEFPHPIPACCWERYHYSEAKFWVLGARIFKIHKCGKHPP